MYRTKAQRKYDLTALSIAALLVCITLGCENTSFSGSGKKNPNLEKNPDNTSTTKDEKQTNSKKSPNETDQVTKNSSKNDRNSNENGDGNRNVPGEPFSSANGSSGRTPAREGFPGADGAQGSNNAIGSGSWRTSGGDLRDPERSASSSAIGSGGGSISGGTVSGGQQNSASAGGSGTSSGGENIRNSNPAAGSNNNRNPSREPFGNPERTGMTTSSGGGAGGSVGGVWKQNIPALTPYRRTPFAEEFWSPDNVPPRTGGNNSFAGSGTSQGGGAGGAINPGPNRWPGGENYPNGPNADGTQGTGSGGNSQNGTGGNSSTPPGGITGGGGSSGNSTIGNDPNQNDGTNSNGGGSGNGNSGGGATNPNFPPTPKLTTIVKIPIAEPFPPFVEITPTPQPPPDKVWLELRVVQLNYEAWWKNCLTVTVADDTKPVACNKDPNGFGKVVLFAANKPPACNAVKVTVQTFKNIGEECTNRMRQGLECEGPYQNTPDWARSPSNPADAQFTLAYDRSTILNRDPLIISAMDFVSLKSSMEAFRNGGANRWIRVFHEDQPKANLDATRANPSSYEEYGIDYNDYIFDVKGENVRFFVEGTGPQNCEGQ